MTGIVYLINEILFTQRANGDTFYAVRYLFHSSAKPYLFLASINSKLQDIGIFMGSSRKVQNFSGSNRLGTMNIGSKGSFSQPG